MKSTEDQIKELEVLMDDLIGERYRKYKIVQDFSVSDDETTLAMRGLSEVKSQINKAQNKLNKLKAEAGWNKDQIKKEDKRNLTRPRELV